MHKIIIELSIAFSEHEIACLIVTSDEAHFKEYETLQLSGIFSDFFNVGIVPVQKKNELHLFPTTKIQDMTLYGLEILRIKISSMIAENAPNFFLEEVSITPINGKPIDLQQIRTEQLIEKTAEIAFHCRHNHPPPGENAKFYRRVTHLACKYRKAITS